MQAGATGGKPSADISGMTPTVHELAPPDGFQQLASGLVVPAASAPPALEREQWTEAEVKTIARANKVLEHRGLVVLLACQDNRCAEQPMVDRREVPGGYAWVCRHKERIVIYGR
jgi:hypothetical protein